VLKTRRLGYDGKGQFVLRAMADIDGAWDALGGTGLIYEKFQDFSREVSLLSVRSVSGHTVFYPLSANTHGGGILRYSVAPFPSARLERAARLYAKRVMNALDYVGVLAIEFFVSEDGWSPMKWRRASIIPDTGPSRAASPANLRITCVPSAACRSAAHVRSGHGHDQFSWADAAARAVAGGRGIGISRLWKNAASGPQIGPLHHP